MQVLERRLPLPQGREQAVDALQRRDQPKARRRKDAQRRDHGTQVRAALDQQHQHEDDHAAEGDGLQHVAGRVAQDVAGRLHARHAVGGRAETCEVDVLQTDDLEFLHPAHRLLDGVVAFSVGLHPDLADSADELADGEEEQAVDGHDRDRAADGDHRLEQAERDDEHERSEDAGHEPQRGQERTRHDLVHLRQDRGAEVGRVPRQEPFIGLMQVAGQQAQAEGIGAHHAEAGRDPHGRELRCQPEDRDEEDDDARPDQELPRAFEAEGVVGPSVDAVRLDHLRLRDHLEERQDRDDRGRLDRREHEGDGAQNPEPTALAHRHQFEQHAVGGNDLGSPAAGLPCHVEVKFSPRARDDEARGSTCRGW